MPEGWPVGSTDNLMLGNDDNDGLLDGIVVGLVLGKDDDDG